MHQYKQSCRQKSVFDCKCVKLHGAQNIKFATAQQAKQIYQYKNIKEKLYKTNAAIYYNKKTSKLKIKILI